MKKITKRIMALILSLVMVIGCIPCNIASADESSGYSLKINNVEDGQSKNNLTLLIAEDPSIEVTIEAIYKENGTDQGTSNFENFEYDNTYYIRYSFNTNIVKGSLKYVKGENSVIGYDMDKFSNYLNNDDDFSIPNKSHICQWKKINDDQYNYKGMITFRIDDWSTLSNSIEGIYPANASTAVKIKDQSDNDLYTVEDKSGVRTIKLLSDIKADNNDYAIYVPEGKKVILDLNGHILDRGLVSANGTTTNNVKGSVIEIHGGELTINDSNPNVEHTGYINSNGLWNPNNTTGEQKIILGGIITGGTGTSNKAENVRYMGGGIFIDRSDNDNYGQLILEAGTIAGNDAFGGGVYLVNKAKFIMNGGNISYNKSNDSGCVYCSSSGTFFTMNDGEISYNTSVGSKSEGGIYNAGITNLNGGKIIFNKSDGFAGGVFAANNGMSISGNVIIKDNINTHNTDGIYWPQNLATPNSPIMVGKLNNADIHISFLASNNGHKEGKLTSGFQANNPGAFYGDYFTYDGPSDKFYMSLNSDGELEINKLETGKYIITILKSENGTVTTDKMVATKDEEVTLNAIAKSGYMIDEYIVKDSSNNDITVEDGKFIMPEENVSVTATFKEAPRSSGSSKKYKASDSKDTAEKISGSGKKGSTRTITPIEGKKVSSVIVTDKDGNKVDVTLNEDGTYSFKQPASDVNIEVTYKNREITLNIGSTEASVDGEKSNLDVCPVIRNDRTMLPIRYVAENLGAKVEWNELETNMVYITRGDTKIEIKIGSDIMKVNGKEVKLDSVAFAENDRTYLPVRAISEALNAIVEWNEERPNEVKIYER